MRRFFQAVDGLWNLNLIYLPELGKTTNGLIIKTTPMYGGCLYDSKANS